MRRGVRFQWRGGDISWWRLARIRSSSSVVLGGLPLKGSTSMIYGSSIPQLLPGNSCITEDRSHKRDLIMWYITTPSTTSSSYLEEDHQTKSDIMMCAYWIWLPSRGASASQIHLSNPLGREPIILGFFYFHLWLYSVEREVPTSIWMTPGLSIFKRRNGGGSALSRISRLLREGDFIVLSLLEPQCI